MLDTIKRIGDEQEAKERHKQELIAQTHALVDRELGRG